MRIEEEEKEKRPDFLSESQKQCRHHHSDESNASHLCDAEIQDKVLSQLSTYQRKLLGDNVDDQLSPTSTAHSEAGCKDLSGPELFHFILRNFKRHK